MEKNETTIRDRIEQLATRTFTIIGCPEKVFLRFVQYCEENARNVKSFRDRTTGEIKHKEELIYHMGLKSLLDAVDADAKNMMIYNKIEKQDAKIEEQNKTIQEMLTVIEDIQSGKTNKDKIVTFGGE